MTFVLFTLWVWTFGRRPSNAELSGHDWVFDRLEPKWFPDSKQRCIHRCLRCGSTWLSDPDMRPPPRDYDLPVPGQGRRVFLSCEELIVFDVHGE